MFPRIVINYNKCTTPFDCKRCLQVCPQAVFDLKTLKMERLKETDAKEPGAFQVVGLYRDKCTGCGDCVEVCPLDAITLSYPEAVKK